MSLSQPAAQAGAVRTRGGPVPAVALHAADSGGGRLRNVSNDVSSLIDELLRFAIAHKRLVGIVYSGRLRVAEPHDYGIMKEQPRLLVYQLHAGDADDSKPVEGWRLLDAARIEACEALEQTFAGSRGRSYQRHMTWDVIFARVG